MTPLDDQLFDAPSPIMVLVRPQMGENIGAAARAMLNFSCARMRLVAPRDGWPNPKAAAMASGAYPVLDRAGLFEDVAGATADCDYVYATTARGRGLTKPVLTPERAMQEARAMLAAGPAGGGAVRAGAGRAGKCRCGAGECDHHSAGKPSLNLAQCVLLVAYEYTRQGLETPPDVMAMAGTDFATGIERTKLGDHFEERLEEAQFFYPADKAEHMRLNLRNMWSRLPLTRADVQTLHGMLRQLVRASQRNRRNE